MPAGVAVGHGAGGEPQAERALQQRHDLGRSAAAVRAPDAGDTEHVAAAEAAFAVLLAVLAGYGITGEDAVDAVRSMRAVLHGFVSLEAASGFGMPQSVDATYARLIDALDTAFVAWSTDSVSAGDRARRSG